MGCPNSSGRPFDGEAKWIWSAEGVTGRSASTGSYRVRFFRRVFDAPAGARLVVRVSADSRCKLWCNGVLVSRGPAKGDVVHQFYDTVDVTAHLRQGANVLAAQVEYYGDVWCSYVEAAAPVSQMTACPGFVLDGVLTAADGRELEALHSDDRWRVLVDSGTYQSMPGSTTAQCVGVMEDFHADRYPWSFQEPDYDEAQAGKEWQSARAICPARCLEADWDSFVPHRLVGRMIAPLAESAPQQFRAAIRSDTHDDLSAWAAMLAGEGEVTIPAGEVAIVYVDVGELTTAYPRVAFSGQLAIVLRYAEALSAPDGRKADRNAPDFGEARGVVDRVWPAGASCVWEPFRWRTFRFIAIEIVALDGPVTIHSLTYSETAYPFKDLAEIETSDPDTPAIGDVCWRTARLCAHETYEDCPYYEQLQYGGDTQVQAMVSYYVAADASLARQWLCQFDWSRQPNGLTRSRYPSRVPQTIPYWSLHWVMGIHDYWMHTGDRETVEDLLTGMMATLDYFDRHRNADGVVGELDGWLVADWCPQWTSDRDGNGVPPGAAAGRSAFSSLITIAALRQAAEVVESLGRDASELLRRAQALREAAHALYYDGSRGLYRDKPVSDPDDVASRYTNVWAVLAGMPPDAGALADAMLDGAGLCELTQFSTYFAWRAMAAAGRYERMGELLGPWREMLRWGLTTCPETPDFETTRSDCHAWGCGPLVEYCREVLGVRPIQPGYAAIGVEPKPGGLAFARGKVPLTRRTGDGPARSVHVDWRIEAGRFILRVASPGGVPCRIRLPDGSTRAMPEGGQVDLACGLDGGDHG